jgi:hypothetical protein
MLYACYVCMLYVGPFIINHPKEEIVDILETHGDTAMPEQAIWPNPWMMMTMLFAVVTTCD